ncbi:hypothetical protein H1R20_g14304, partial [Candolleomyces eurysporus]
MVSPIRFRFRLLLIFYQAPRKRLLIIGFIVATSLYLVAAGWFGTGFHRQGYDDDDVSFAAAAANANSVGGVQSNKPPLTSSNKRVLLVSALYPLSKSKHSLEDYRWWLWNYLGHVKTDIYFFAPPALHDLVTQARPKPDEANSKEGSNFFLKLNTTYPTVFDVPPLKGLQQSYEEIHAKDRERSYHSAELYAVWNAKPFFLKEGLREMKETWGRDYDYAFWVDAGSFRESPHKYEDWPDPARVEEVFAHSSSEDSIFIPMHGMPSFKWRKWKEEMGPVDQDISEGSFFGGSHKAIEWYTSTFYTYHDHYLSLGHFVGKDQTLINAILLLFPDRFTAVFWRDITQRGFVRTYIGSACGGEWWYYQFFLANSQTRTEMEKIWLGKQSNRQKKVQEWLVGKPQCPLVPPLTLKEVLYRAFGPYWKPVPATVVPKKHVW